MNHRTRVVVRRGSHVQYAPQMGLAHSGPVTRVMVVKTTPISAEATAIRSYSNSFFHRYRIPQINTTVKAGPRAHELAHLGSLFANSSITYSTATTEIEKNTTS